MKIGILGTRGIPNSYGGFEQFAEHLAFGLVQRGHHVFVYTSNLNPYKEKDWRGVNLIPCKNWEDKLGTAGQFVYDLNCINDARGQNFDVLLHLGYTSDSIWHRRWPRHTINVVNMDGLEWKRTKYSKPSQWFLKKAERWAALHADHLISDSTEIKKYLLTQYQKHSTYIPYGADVCTHGDASLLNALGLQPLQYFLMVARLEPENNIQMVIEGVLRTPGTDPLVIIGNPTTALGKKLQRKYSLKKIRFVGAIYDQVLLNNLRFFSRLYFHGHSVGGTNPSLLEAMACGCQIAAHDNVFNRAVTEDRADYYSTADQVEQIISQSHDETTTCKRRETNFQRIQSVYAWAKVIDQYEKLMLDLVRR
jgi:glycosyltransferase involved in cell wall biosynthesis